MYQYDEKDHRIVRERVEQFRDQTRRFLAGELTEDEFRPLRLMNGLYIQKQAPMLRVAIPYGQLSSEQLRTLARISRVYDKGYGHFTTRQNIQFNWPKLEDVPDMLDELANVEMHAIQTSGNCIRNTTTDAFAGVAQDEIVDPRPWCEIIRQWGTLHPEFAFLPRKFKIAVSGSTEDRAAIRVHDVGLQAVYDAQNELGFTVFAGGGLGRTPMIGEVIKPFLPACHLLTYLEAILRIYNRFGRRDNKYKARIKILVKAMTPEAFAAKVETEWLTLKHGPSTLSTEIIQYFTQFFVDPSYQVFSEPSSAFMEAQYIHPAFARWVRHNTHLHKVNGYRSVTLSLKATGVPPGDISADQMEVAADLADEFSFGQLRVTHQQNLVLADVPEQDLYAIWERAKVAGFATANIGLLTDITCCPGGDFCSLANARSIPLAKAIQEAFSDQENLEGLGKIDCNFSGCINACAHHHIGNIGILGVDKNGEEWYQITLGGSQGANTQIGKIIGPSFSREAVPKVFRTLMQICQQERHQGEYFVDVVRRLGVPFFKEKVYALHH